MEELIKTKLVLNQFGDEDENIDETEEKPEEEEVKETEEPLEEKEKEDEFYSPDDEL